MPSTLSVCTTVTSLVALSSVIGCSSLTRSSSSSSAVSALEIPSRESKEMIGSLEASLRSPSSLGPSQGPLPLVSNLTGPCNNGGESVKIQGMKSERCDRVIVTPQGPKTVHIVSLRGNSQQAAMAHGYLMARELEEGILKTATDITKANTNNALLQGLYNCYSNRMKRSISKDFMSVVDAVWLGYNQRYKDAGITPKYSREDTLNAILGIEIANVAEGLEKRVSDNPAVVGEVIASCGLRAPLNLFIDALRPEARTHLKPEDLVREAIREWGANAPKLGGCIGFSIPAALTKDKEMLHARNLDIDMVDGWNVHPTLFIVEHTGKTRFVASAAAGMVVPGGIGGMNEHGLAISLHQMSTTKYVSETGDGQIGIIAPALTQKILEEARTIEEATALIEKGVNFASWTMFISEAKSGRVAAIEFSGERVRTVYLVQNETKGQTNHFLHPEMQDQAFTYNYNKFFESQSRLRFIESEMQKLSPQKPADTEWVISKLAGHDEVLPDSPPGQKYRRAFGRTAVKAYNVMSVLMIPEQQQYWSTIAERNPAAHSTWVGYKIDWQNLKAEPFTTKRVRDYAKTPNWDRSLSKYVEARQTYQSYLGNNPTRARELLTEAIELAKKDGIDEYPYYFMRARVTHELGMQEKMNPDKRKKFMRDALKDWDFLWSRKDHLYIYGQALVAAYSTATEDELEPRFDNWHQDTEGDRYYYKRGPGKQEKVQFAFDTLEQLSKKFKHFDLDAKRKLVKKMLRPQRDLDLPSLDFVVVEQ